LNKNSTRTSNASTSKRRSQSIKAGVLNALPAKSRRKALKIRLPETIQDFIDIANATPPPELTVDRYELAAEPLRSLIASFEELWRQAAADNTHAYTYAPTAGQLFPGEHYLPPAEVPMFVWT